MRKFLGMIQKVASKSRALSLFALKVRNQCNAIIANYIGKAHEGAESGEHWFLENYVGSEPATLFDVGANRGDWTKAALKLSGETTVYSYEPDPRAVSQYRDSMHNNENVFFHDVAIGSEVGEMKLFLAKHSTEHSTAAPVANKDYTSSTVQVSTVDAQVKQHRIDYIDLLKIDVEGYESMVLKGASETLRKEKIGCIQFEYGENWKNAGATLTHVCSFLESHDFRTFLLRPKTLKVIDIDVLGEYFSYSNYIAVHKRNVENIVSLISKSKIL